MTGGPGGRGVGGPPAAPGCRQSLATRERVFWGLHRSQKTSTATRESMFLPLSRSASVKAPAVASAAAWMHLVRLPASEGSASNDCSSLPRATSSALQEQSPVPMPAAQTPRLAILLPCAWSRCGALGSLHASVCVSRSPSHAQHPLSCLAASPVLIFPLKASHETPGPVPVYPSCRSPKKM